MAPSRKKTITTSLPENELAELDRIREEYKMTRSQALREALRRYLAAMRSLPAPEEPSPGELEALREAEEEFARGGGRELRAVLHDAPTLPSPACGGGGNRAERALARCRPAIGSE
jgi:ribbon-helix-helix CopG family protein